MVIYYKKCLLIMLSVPLLTFGAEQNSNLDPVTYQVYKANAFAHKGQYPQALEALNQAISLDRSAARAYKVRGHVYVAMGDLPKAIADLGKVVELVPDSANALVDRSIVHYKLGHRTDALKDIKRALDLAPDSAFAQGVRDKFLEG